MTVSEYQLPFVTVHLRFEGGPWSGRARVEQLDLRSGRSARVLYYTEDREAGAYWVDPLPGDPTDDDPPRCRATWIPADLEAKLLPGRWVDRVLPLPSCGDVVGTPGRDRTIDGEDGSDDRCRDVDPDAGRCQFIVDHDGQHGAAVDGSYLTWDDGALVRWPIRQSRLGVEHGQWAAGFSPSGKPPD